MKLTINSLWGGLDYDDGTASGESHSIYDEETGAQVLEREFDSLVEATLYLAAMRPELEARGLPPMSDIDEEHMSSNLDMLRRGFGQIDKGLGTLTEATVGYAERLFKKAEKWPHSERLEAVIEEVRQRLAVSLERHPLSPATPQAVADAPALSAGELAVQLDLAITYMELGDCDASRILLKEVMDKGSPDQRERAVRILKEMG